MDERNELITMARRKYKIPVKYIFEGEFIITAESRKQAEADVREHCGAVLGGGIHSTLDDDDVDWDFDIHPDVKILKK